MSKAYMCMLMRVVPSARVPVVQSVGIYSESSRSLEVLGREYFYVDLLEAKGKDFSDAKDRLLVQAKVNTRWNWAYRVCER
jgi:hypothetical protein